MGEFPSDEVGHGDEVVDAAITTGAGTCLLKCSIHCFDTAVVFAGFEAVEYARKVLGKGPAEALEGFQSATTGPTQPALQQGLGLVRRPGGGIDLGFGKVLGGARLEGPPHVPADLANRGRLAPHAR